jgi:flagellar hook-associated protein 1
MGYSILGTLNTAKQGMMVSQAGISITGQNAANVDTDGYSRKRIVSVAQSTNLGGGVSVANIRRYTDEFATTRLIQERVAQGYAKNSSGILSQICDLFNDLHEDGLGSALDNFYSSIELLETSPKDLTVRQEVIACAEELASAFNRISAAIESVRSNTDNLLKSTAEEVNTRTAELQTLNKEIVLSTAAGNDISDLLDRREQLLVELSDYASISYIETDNNQITVFLEDGLPLVEGNNRCVLEVQESAAPGASRVFYVTEGGVSTDITASLDDGALGGILDTRDNVIPNWMDDLDQLAYDIVTAYNAVHSAGVGLDGSTGLDLFTALGSATNAAALMEVSSSVVNNPEAIAAAQDITLLPGDNTNALALADLTEQDLAAGGTQTFNEAYSTIVGEVGLAANRAAAEVETRASSIDRIEEIRDSESAVSLDEEMTSLIQYQRAYQASARVLNVITEVLDTILALGQ